MATADDRPTDTHGRPIRRVVVVSSLLPVILERTPEGNWSASWDEKVARPELAVSRYVAVGVRRLKVPSLFIGSPQCFVPRSERPAVEAAIAAAGLNVICVYHEPSVAHQFYQGFCKSALWPVMHNVIDVYNPASVEPQMPASPVPPRRATGEPDEAQAWHAPRSYNPAGAQEVFWPAYCEVNRSLAAAVVEHYLEDDLIWIHHYHLMLLPAYLLRKLRSANIGVFIHQPFPSSEIFRCLANRDELLRGLLCADHIGFHLFECAKRLLACCRPISPLRLPYLPIPPLYLPSGGPRTSSPAAAACSPAPSRSHPTLTLTRTQPEP